MAENLPSVFSTSLGKTILIAWRFILNENCFDGLYQKQFVVLFFFSIPLSCSQIFTVKLN